LCKMEFVFSPILLNYVVNCRYWKERAFALNELSLIDRIMSDVTCVGIVYGAQNKPTPFFCLLVKLVQMKPELESVRHLITVTDGPCTDDPAKRRDLRYVRVLGALYLRLTQPASPAVYTLLEGLYADRRQVNVVFPSGEADSLPMDVLAEWLLAQKSQTLLGLTLPLLVRRAVHETRRKLKPYESFLTDVTEADKAQARQARDSSPTNALATTVGQKPLSF
jgi:hypothetical protein